MLICLFLLAAYGKSYHVAGKDHVDRLEGQKIHLRYKILERKKYVKVETCQFFLADEC